MAKIIIVILAAAIGIGIASPCYCEYGGGSGGQSGEDGNHPAEQNVPAAGQYREIKTIDGKINDIDWAGSKVVVKWLDSYNNSYHEAIINVPDNAVAKKSFEVIEFSELEVGDDVTAKYYEDSDGTDTLISLEVTSP